MKLSTSAVSGAYDHKTIDLTQRAYKICFKNMYVLKFNDFNFANNESKKE